MKLEDEDVRAILFLDQHPAWSWSDLMDAPDDIVDGLMDLANRKATAQKARP